MSRRTPDWTGEPLDGRPASGDRRLQAVPPREDGVCSPVRGVAAKPSF